MVPTRGRTWLCAAALLVAAGASRALTQDAGGRDGGARDAGARDAGARDAGARSAVPRDGGAPDAARPPSSPPPTKAIARDPRRVYAKTSSFTVTARDLAAAINARSPWLRPAPGRADQVEEIAVELVRERLLATEARRRRLHGDPDIRREIDRVLARALLDRELASIDARPVSPADIERYYRAHLSDFTRPEQVRITALVVDDVVTARRLIPQLRRSNPWNLRFLARRWSRDRRTRTRSGDFGWHAREGGPADLRPLVEAAFALAHPGDVANEPVVGVDARFYVVRLEERRAPEVVPLGQVRATIDSRIRHERRAQAIDRLAETLGRASGLELHPASPLIRIQPIDAGAGR